MSTEAVHHAAGPGLHELLALINLGVVAAIIFVAGRKGIKASLAERSASISKNLIEAKEELERTKKEIEKAKREVDGIEQMKEQILAETRTQGETLSAQLIREARHTAERIVSDARTAAQNEVWSASRKLREILVKKAVAESIDLVDAGGSDAQELKARLHNRLVERFVSESSNLKTSYGSKGVSNGI